MPGWRFAFALSRKAVKSATPPGTVVLIGNHNTNNNGNGNTSNGNNSHFEEQVVKVPTPTPDPADPLNWPTWRKAACMISVAWYAFVCNYISASIAPALPLWNHAFPGDRRREEELMRFVAFNVLVLGLGNIIWVPLANIYGRRLILILSTTLLSAATTFGVFQTGYMATLLIRIFQGLGSSASETVTPAIVGDLFFVHERGGWMAFYSASLATGSVVGGITGGYIAAELGWTRQFYVGMAISGIASLAVMFLVPETMFDRSQFMLPIELQLPRVRVSGGRNSGHRHSGVRVWSSAPRQSLMTLPSIAHSRFTRRMTNGSLLPEEMQTWYEEATDDGEEQGQNEEEDFEEDEELRRASTRVVAGRGIASTAAPSAYPPFSFLRSLRLSPYRGHVFHHFCKPWSALRLPATWIIMLQYGGLVGSVAVISTVGPQVLSRPPYRWGEHAGLLFVGALAGIVLGGLWTGLVADWMVKWRARSQESGFAEPEARVGVVVPALVVATCGLLVFGACAQSPGENALGWVGLEVAFGMVSFALAQVPSIWFGYLIDAYDQLASDCFVMICVFRGAIPFAWTLVAAQWIEKAGYLVPFGGFAGIMAVFSMLIIPVVCGGKRMRIATARFVVANQ
ncbi:major facilitator superfamily domain-containing protein [Dichotomopilus funicola]|uniref:Major facilitator superfamily domain-containing protein n=1 Tax=Dichotomopilus funicola TaxID=1934379 RepID=A0AAN6V0K3_9PEZI|nr:major facilitator superfamily domain-containing protein [Dichotomopilus funicola]